MWSMPTELLFYSLKVNPAQTFHQFKQLLDSILTNLHVCADPLDLHKLVTDLWMGEMIWRKFAENLLKVHIPGGALIPPRWEQIGCLRRKDTSASQMIMMYDEILWICIPQMSQLKYESAWQWIIQEVDGGEMEQDVLDRAGGVWLKMEQLRLAAKANGTQSLMILEGPDLNIAIDSNTDMEEDKNEECPGQGAMAEGGPLKTQTTIDPSNEGQVMDQDDGGDLASASPTDHAMDNERKTDRSAASTQVVVAEGGRSRADQVMADIEKDGHSGSTGQDNNPAAGNQSTVSSQGFPWTGESAAYKLERYPNLVVLVDTFRTFIHDKNTQVLEATLKDLVPATRHTSVENLMTCMHERLLDDAMWESSSYLKEFFDGEMAVLAMQAREEAIQAQNRLL
ncbi:hypothetical protein CY34DRAFT_110921 [Suillus luteus UH-Slu-Lm8-n1]|uniref:Uncharacterized protein n=1 Tax=Suillus luteus UH-Slu-Lm8-n1 TaxID=930992 RepID=A0A0C9Z592_9AGAM|nr:hypothetical protein CY34DRAFT_110921 [Suillus luteus UH-Slu-Lm8-n1]